MQADARLVEHVKNAGQARADLGREPDALRLAAGKRAALAVEREIIEPDFDEEIAAATRSRAPPRRRSLRCCSVSSSRPMNRAAAAIVSSENWWMFCLGVAAVRIVTARISGFSRAPWQT